MDDFLAAVDPDQGSKIVIRGEPVFVVRRRLLDHLRLSQIEIKIGQAGDSAAIADLIERYLLIGGLTPDQLEKASTYELIEAFFTLKILNAWQWVLPWLAKPDTNPGEPEIYDYQGRRWAIWVHKLGSRYGWPPETIWRLYPEEAAAYLQEIMVSEYHEREDTRALSELSYKYDEITRKGKFIPSPAYNWMIDDKPPETIKVLRRALPVGNVIKVED